MARNKKVVNNEELDGDIQSPETQELDGDIQSPETQEVAEVQEVAETPEEAALKQALAQDDVVGALTELKATTTGKLPALISTFIALKNALGDDSPATQNALSNLHSFKTEAGKPAKEPKAKAFNEKTVLAVALKEGGDLKALQEDTRISEKLKALLVTYNTLVSIEDESLAPAVELALVQLRTYASKSRSLSNKNSIRIGQPSVRMKTKVITKDGKTFVTATLASGIKALGITDKVEIHTAWKKINTAKFKAGETIDFEGHQFSLTDEPIVNPTPNYGDEQIGDIDSYA